MAFALIVAILIQCAATLAALWSPVTMAKDAEIRVLRERIGRLEIHKDAVERHRETMVEYEREKVANAKARDATAVHEAEVMRLLQDLAVPCGG